MIRFVCFEERWPQRPLGWLQALFIPLTASFASSESQYLHTPEGLSLDRMNNQTHERRKLKDYEPAQGFYTAQT